MFTCRSQYCSFFYLPATVTNHQPLKAKIGTNHICVPTTRPHLDFGSTLQSILESKVLPPRETATSTSRKAAPLASPRRPSPTTSTSSLVAVEHKAWCDGFLETATKPSTITAKRAATNTTRKKIVETGRLFCRRRFACKEIMTVFLFPALFRCLLFLSNARWDSRWKSVFLFHGRKDDKLFGCI